MLKTKVKLVEQHVIITWLRVDMSGENYQRESTVERSTNINITQLIYVVLQ